jgi:hypothetical protein
MNLLFQICSVTGSDPGVGAGLFGQDSDTKLQKLTNFSRVDIRVGSIDF